MDSMYAVWASTGGYGTVVAKALHDSAMATDAIVECDDSGYMGGGRGSHWYWLFRDLSAANLVACALAAVDSDVSMQNLALFNMQESMAQGPLR